MNSLNNINLPVSIIADNNGSPSELNLVRNALLFYAEHLREQSNRQQNPDLLLKAATLEDVLENLTQQAFDALGERSQQLLTQSLIDHA